MERLGPALPCPRPNTPPAPASAQGEQDSSSSPNPRTASCCVPRSPLTSTCLDLLNNPGKEFLSIPILQLGQLKLWEVKFQGHGTNMRQRESWHSNLQSSAPRMSTPPTLFLHTHVCPSTHPGGPSLPAHGQGSHADWHHTLPSASSWSKSFPEPAKPCSPSLKVELYSEGLVFLVSRPAVWILIPSFCYLEQETQTSLGAWIGQPRTSKSLPRLGLESKPGSQAGGSRESRGLEGRRPQFMLLLLTSCEALGKSLPPLWA